MSIKNQKFLGILIIVFSILIVLLSRNIYPLSGLIVPLILPFIIMYVYKVLFFGISIKGNFFNTILSLLTVIIYNTVLVIYDVYTLNNEDANSFLEKFILYFSDNETRGIVNAIYLISLLEVLVIGIFLIAFSYLKRLRRDY
jgi:hypothetical protein